MLYSINYNPDIQSHPISRAIQAKNPVDNKWKYTLSSLLDFLCGSELEDFPKSRLCSLGPHPQSPRETQ